MKKSVYNKLTIVAVVTCLLCACESNRQGDDGNDNVKIDLNVHQSQCDTAILNSANYIPETLTDIHQPDMKKVVRKGCALVLETEGFQLIAVDSTVLHSGEYSVTSLDAEEIAPIPQGMINVTAVSSGYRLLPCGEHFSPYAELHIAYTPEQLPLGYCPEDVYTSYYDTSAMAWVRLKRLYVDTVNHEIVSATNHFTDFINEVLKAPEMPETQAFVPTQISGLEAANPLSEYTTIAPPEANNMGSVNLAYPFHIPVGRGNVQPSVALTYNSNGGNGVCGMGWDLPIPCISVETRWGVPLYSADNETETYLFNGEQLLVSHDSMPTFARRYEPRSTEYTKRFYPRVEGAFDSILRHGTTPQTYWWEVFDRSGNQYIYGLGDGELRSYREGAIAKWYLTRVIDRNGNATRYQYVKYKNGEAGGNASGTALFLDKITYTSPDRGFPEMPWYGYCVSFHYRDRDDPVITCNYGAKENICKMLDSVRTWYVKNLETAMVAGDYVSNENTAYGYKNETSLMATDDKMTILSWLDGRDAVTHIDSSLVRGYRLLYKSSLTTGKSLLTAVIEMGASEWDSLAVDITENDLTGFSPFKYYLFCYNDHADIMYDSTTKTISTTEILDAESGLPNIYASPLGGSKSYRSSANFGTGVGIGFDMPLRTLNFEASGSISLKNINEGTNAMIDINGDGYPDILYYNGDEEKWGCMLFSPEDTAFMPSDEVTVVFPTDGFSKTKTRSDFSIGTGAHAGFETEVIDIGANVGIQYSHSVSENIMYFTDFNADGKPDMVKNGIVWFNNSHDDTVNFDRFYVPQTNFGSICESDYFSLEDAVGLDSLLFKEGHPSQTFVFSLPKGQNDIDSTIVTTELQASAPDTLRRSVVRVWVAPETGIVRISGTAMLDSTFNVARENTNSDGVHVSIQKQNDIISGTSHDLTLSVQQYNMNVQRLKVIRGDCVFFRVEALENDLYDVVDWCPRIVYLDKDTTILDNAGRKKYVFAANDDFLAWQKERFTMPIEGSIHISASYLFRGVPHSDITLSVIKYDTLGSIVDVIDRRAISSSDPMTLIPSSWELDLPNLDTIHSLGFVVESPGNFDRSKLDWSPHITSTEFSNGSEAKFKMYDENGDSTIVHAIDKYISPLFPDESLDVVSDSVDVSVFGNPNHGWGCFMYNSDTLRTPIVLGKIKTDARYDILSIDSVVGGIDSTYNDSTSVSVASVMSDIDVRLPNPDGADVSTLRAMVGTDTTKRVLVAFAGKGYVTPTQVGLFNWYTVQSAMGDSSILVPVTNQSVASSGITAVGPIKETNQRGFSVYLSGGLTIGGFSNSVMNDFGIDTCFNYSFGSNHLDIDYTDFNGDGYPDAISGNEAQYSNQRGGLSGKKAGVCPTGKQGIQKTEYNAFSLQGGSSSVSFGKLGKSRGKVDIRLRGNMVGVNSNNSVAMSQERLSYVWIDVNGDGLPDCVDGDSVAFNLGYGYYKADIMADSPLTENQSVSLNKSTTANFTAPSGIDEMGNCVQNTINCSFSTGKSITESVNSGKMFFVDMNGDGLVDKIAENGRIFFNQGWGFYCSPDTIKIEKNPEDISHNIDYSGNITVGFPIWGNIKGQGSAGINISNSASTTETVLMDMNADGLPDLVWRDDENIKIRYNTLFSIDKLESVESFYGNRMDFYYSQADYSPKARQRPTVMDSLVVHDITGTSSDRRIFSFAYSGYVHSVAERTPYGFDSIVVTQYIGEEPYRITRQHYRTDTYKMRGKKHSELITDAEGHPFVESVWNYELKQISNGAVVNIDSIDCFGSTWPALDSAVTRHYDPTTGTIKIETAEKYNHVDSGRVSEYVNFNNLAVPNDDVHCMVYYTRRGCNQYALPKRMLVKNYTGDTLRHRSAVFDDKGMLSELILHNDDDSLTATEYTYDMYGNTLSCEMPPNNNGERVKYLYSYDTLMHQFRILTTDDAFGDVSRAEYDVRLGVPLRIYSIGGDSISYTYDDLGRPLTIRAPQEHDTSGFPTIRYLYWDGGHHASQIANANTEFYSYTKYPADAGNMTEPDCNVYHGRPVWAQTLHRSALDTSLKMTTVLFADGYGRVLQTRKTAVVAGDSTQVASGLVFYDDAGRAIEIHEPFVSDLTYCEYDSIDGEGVISLTEYDILDRPVLTRLSYQNITTEINYDFDSVEGIVYFKNTTTDPENRSCSILADARGLTVQSIDAMHGVTQFEYDAMGQLLQSVDPEGFATNYTYTMLGQLSSRNHPDAGQTSYKYDRAGNMILENNPLGSIKYKYNYQRLIDKNYSILPENDVHYTYGNNGRNKGKVTAVDDGSGMQVFDYDEFGRVSRSVRILSVPSSGNVYAFTHTYQYDSWNRMWRMTYPDGEVVSYRYNKAGDFVYMCGDKDTNHRPYVDDVKYNKYGQKIAIDYGNGTHTDYSYDPLHRLSSLLDKDGSSGAMQNLHYSFDKVGNITAISNTATGVLGLGGIYSNTYVYDSLNRLVSAHGVGTLNGQTCRFDIPSMDYSASGRIGGRRQVWSAITTQGEQGMVYGYPANNDKPHAPRRITDNSATYDLRWDNAGNLGRVAVQGVQNPSYRCRFLYWTEDNRLYTVADDNYYSYYAYDHTGERMLKMTGDVSRLDVNAGRQNIYYGLEHVTMYPSPYMVLSEHGYTKHYYVGTDRICARIGSGGLSHDTNCVTINSTISHRVDSLFLNCRNIINNYTYSNDDFYVVNIDGDTVNMAHNGGPIRLVSNASSEPWSFLTVVQRLSRTNPPSGTVYAEEPDVYFYHGDHLGSASWITNRIGKPVQHLQYLPFGQPYINQRTENYQERFTFTGKERDEETGYGYFGARYMDHELLTSFISVDRYASKYPSISPYAYCAWNPIRLTDPTGDTLVAKDAASQRDIKGVAGEYGNRFFFDDNGMATIDYSDMTDKEKKEMNKHIGVHLLKDIIESDKWFLYEASDITCVTTIEGNSICGTMYNDNNGVMNLSRYGRDSNRGYSYMPQNGFDGQVIIAISGSWKDHRGFNARNKIVSHELAENYARTHLKYDFHEGETRSAHLYAINRMKDLNYGSYTYEPHFNLVNLQLLYNEKSKKYLGF